MEHQETDWQLKKQTINGKVLKTLDSRQQRAASTGRQEVHKLSPTAPQPAAKRRLHRLQYREGRLRQTLMSRWRVCESGETGSQGRVLDNRAAQNPRDMQVAGVGGGVSLDQHKLMRNLYKPEENATQKHYREGYLSSYNNPCRQSRKLHIHGGFKKAHRKDPVSPTKAKEWEPKGSKYFWVT